MKVLFVSHVSNKYGAGRSLLDLIDGLLEKGVSCYVVLPEPGPMEAELEHRRVEYQLIPFRPWVSTDRRAWQRLLHIRSNLRTLPVIAAKARSWQADIIYTNSSVTPVGALAALLIRKPHIWHITEFGEEDFNLSFDFGSTFSMMVIDRLSFRVIVVSEALRRKYLEYMAPDRVKLVYNPATLGNAASRRDSASSGGSRQDAPPSVAIIGFLHPQKGQMDAVLAVAKLANQGVKVRLSIVGDGEQPYLDRLKQAVAQKGIQEWVCFAGYRDDVAPVMESSDAILVCSRAEAFGRVTVEAMLSRKPVIGTRSGATPELVKEGFNGLLYEPGHYEELAERIKYLIDHPQQARQMGQNGFLLASTKFTRQRYADAVYGVLQQAQQQKRR